MIRPNNQLAKSLLFLLSCSLFFVSGMWGQAAAEPDLPVLVFEALPSPQLLSLGEPVVLVLYLRNRSEEPIFVSRLKGDEFVTFKVIGPDGQEVPWQGKSRSTFLESTSTDFDILNRYDEIAARKVISFESGAGFVFDKPGQYTVTAEYSLETPEHFASFAGDTKIPTGVFRSRKAAFCVEACVLGPELAQDGAELSEHLRIRPNVPQSALKAVRVFYTHVTRFQPLGIPEGSAKKALWPLLSKRLVLELDTLQACDNDYYRRFGDILKANQFKPATPWLEEGLFSGTAEAATPIKFSILGSRAIGEKRVDVHLRFTHKQTYCCGHPTSYEHYEGVVTAILENNHWAIDDFVGLYSNDELIRLSDGYTECKGGQWVGETYE